MSRAEIEKRRRDRSRSGGSASAVTETDDGGRPTGLFVVAALVGVGGAADLAVGAGLLASPLFLFGVVLASLGAVKLWAAVGLWRLRTRALGVAVLLHVVGATLGVGRAIFAAGTGGSPTADALRVLVDVIVVGYLLVVADAFE